jgi:hypothetical protein
MEVSMDRSVSYLSIILLILMATALHAQEGEQGTRLEFLDTGDARWFAIIQDSDAPGTPLSKLLPKTQCGSFDCKYLTRYMKNTGLDVVGTGKRGSKIWVIEVKPKKLAPNENNYDPNKKYKFQLLELAPTDVRPEPGPEPGVDPGEPIPADPTCGPSDVCPEPGQKILREINSGQLIPVQEIPLHWSSKRFVKRLINATDQVEKNPN